MLRVTLLIVQRIFISRTVHASRHTVNSATHIYQQPLNKDCCLCLHTSTRDHGAITMAVRVETKGPAPARWSRQRSCRVMTEETSISFCIDHKCAN